MVDTNILLDALTRREPFYANAREFLALCECGSIQGVISASAVTDVFYLIRKAFGSTEQAYQAMGDILDIVTVLSVTAENVNDAFFRRARDFEDCLLAVCAKTNRCDGIVTRNKRDFLNFGIALYAPEEVLRIFGQTKEE